MFDALRARHVRSDYVCGLASFDAYFHPDPSTKAEFVSAFIEHVRSESAKSHGGCTSCLTAFSFFVDAAGVDGLAFSANSYFLSQSYLHGDHTCPIVLDIPSH
jgi:hypothetical protein